jgi:diaminopimelate epimerase
MVARFVADGPGDVTVETDAGVLPATVHPDGTVTVQMATARLAGPQYAPTDEPFPHAHRFVSIGNPHVTIAVDDVAAFPLASDGPALEHHPWLPERANVEVWRRTGDDAVEMRVWERGVGETDACGSGACAVAVAATLAGVGDGTVDVRSPGGTLRITVGADLSVRMTGPAERVATVVLSDHLLQELSR